MTVTPEEVIAEVYGGIQEWTMAVHFNETFRSEAAALQAHGLLAPVVEFRFDGGTESDPRLIDADEVSTPIRTPFVPEQFMSLGQFANANRMYLSSLKRYIESHVGGLDAPTDISEA